MTGASSSGARLRLPAAALKTKGVGDHADSQDALLLGQLGHYRRCTRARPAAHARRDEHLRTANGPWCVPRTALPFVGMRKVQPMLDTTASCYALCSQISIQCVPVPKASGWTNEGLPPAAASGPRRTMSALLTAAARTSCDSTAASSPRLGLPPVPDAPACVKHLACKHALASHAAASHSTYPQVYIGGGAPSSW